MLSRLEKKIALKKNPSKVQRRLILHKFTTLEPTTDVGVTRENDEDGCFE
jgi:hypothetical protein